MTTEFNDFGKMLAAAVAHLEEISPSAASRKALGEVFASLLNLEPSQSKPVFRPKGYQLPADIERLAGTSDTPRWVKSDKVIYVIPDICLDKSSLCIRPNQVADLSKYGSSMVEASTEFRGLLESGKIIPSSKKEAENMDKTQPENIFHSEPLRKTTDYSPRTKLSGGGNGPFDSVIVDVDDKGDDRQIGSPKGLQVESASEMSGVNQAEILKIPVIQKKRKFKPMSRAEVVRLEKRKKEPINGKKKEKAVKVRRVA